ncbi:glycosyltransferase family 4 protein [Candidatus Microgenomates bacterium]|nr:glycosyltransferase family 4 protein [Candidatus Microgenomates bacterium]
MKILIDARMYGLEHAGIGRYVENLVEQLMELDKENEYVLLMRKSPITNHTFDKLSTGQSLITDRCQLVETDIPHYSLGEQTKLLRLLNRTDFDIAHFPHFNVPVFFNKLYVLTIHDLIKHTSRGMKTTTKNPLLYWAKYAGYKTVFSNAVVHAKKIIVPSNAVKEDLLKNYKISPGKVEVIYEGVEEGFKSPITNHTFDKLSTGQSLITLKKYKIATPYVIYTGSAYPHKNLERLIEAVKYFNDIYQYSEPINLVICGSRNVFLERLQKVVKRNKAEKYVKFLGYIPDEELVMLYRNARAFVFPSLAEGFGLPGIEAIAAGCPLLCSDIPVSHEIYGKAAVYFNPTDSTDIADKIKQILADGELRESMVSKGKERVKRFSWRKMAQETLEVYKKTL